MERGAVETAVAVGSHVSTVVCEALRFPLRSIALVSIVFAPVETGWIATDESSASFHAPGLPSVSTLYSIPLIPPASP